MGIPAAINIYHDAASCWPRRSLGATGTISPTKTQPSPKKEEDASESATCVMENEIFAPFVPFFFVVVGGSQRQNVIGIAGRKLEAHFLFSGGLSLSLSGIVIAGGKSRVVYIGTQDDIFFFFRMALSIDLPIRLQTCSSSRSAVV